MEEILQLVTSARYIHAKKKYEALTEYLQELSLDAEDRVALENQLTHYDPIIKQMLNRAAETANTLDVGDVDDSWTLAMSYLGVTTHYKTAPDGSITVRLEGLLEQARAFEQAAVLHEVDLYTQWSVG